MHGETINYEADGLAMQGQLYVGGDGGPRPGILVFPEALGLGEHAMAKAERLAEQGFVALACDLHGGRTVHDDLGVVIRILSEFKDDPSKVLRRTQGGLDALLARPEVDPSRVAAIGYCFGGSMALEMARAGDPVAAVAGFHSGLAPLRPDATRTLSAPVLVCIGADDPSIDRAQRAAFEDEMRQAGARWQIHLYGGVVHSFTNPQADARGAPDFSRYDAGADARSWAAMLTFFDEVFGAARTA